MPKSTGAKSTASRGPRALAATKAATTRKRRASGRRAAITKKQRAAAAKARSTRRPRTAPTALRQDAHLRESSLIAFLATADGSRARTFYESLVGLRFISDDQFALVFDANGVMVRIQRVDAVTPAAYTTLGWRVGDIAATIRRLTAKGVQMERYGGLTQDNLGVWTSPSGARIAWFRDPDGHVLSLTQY